MNLCIMMHDWWDSGHSVEMRDCGMSQALWCSTCRVWRHR